MYHADVEFFSPARLRAAAAVRALAHALVGHDADDAVLSEVAAGAEGLTAALAAGPDRSRPDDGLARWEVVRHEGEELSCFADCMVAGPANPLSSGAVTHREGDEAVLRVSLADGFGGLPGRSHGGILASLFDEVLGFALFMEGVPGYTAWLRVDYRAPVRVGVPLEIRARVTERDGRKYLIEAALTSPDGPGPTASALYISPRTGGGT